MGWRQVTTWETVPQGASEHVVAQRMIALVREGDTLVALDGMCSHQGGPLGQGQLDSTGTSGRCYLTCPWHGWQYDIADGQHRTSPIRQSVFPVKIEEEQVWILLDDDEQGDGDADEGAKD